MSKEKLSNRRPKRRRSKKLIVIIAVEILTLILIVGVYWLFVNRDKMLPDKQEPKQNETKVEAEEPDDKKNELSQEELEAIAERERLEKERTERQDLIAQADLLALGYDYDGAIELLKSYKGTEGGYQIYVELEEAVNRLEAEKASLVLYGGSYDSITQINHIFFHSLIADNSKAFDGDYMAAGYNMYMTTISEFKKIIQKMYDDGYVLIRMADIVKQVTLEDGTTEYQANEIYLREGKKPFVLSVDDVNYYDYMKEDGFAYRIVIGEDGKPTCAMKQDDGTIITGDFDVVPILDDFVEQHPDFSYKGAKGLLALTGYEGVLGYRTDDPTSPTYEQDKIEAKKVADALKADGWEFGSHSYNHRNMGEVSFDFVKKDTDRWLEEVAPLIGPTDILVFPFGVDIETTMGTYKSDKYKYLKEHGFNFYLGVYSQPWMHIKKEYVRMTRRPLDGQAMLQFPERLMDLFDPKDIIDPERPPRDW